MTVTLVSAFLLGCWGSIHCVGMCGGIVGVMHNSLAVNNRSNLTNKWLFWLVYNSGRIFSYSLAGILAGWIGSNLFSLINPASAHQIGLVLSGLFMIAFGLYLAGWWNGLLVLEKKGALIWRHLSPLSKRIIPVEKPHQAFLLGMLWGWLPCGLVYVALAWMFTLPGPFSGMLHMAAFGLGTLPMLLLMSAAAEKVSSIAKRSLTRTAVGSVVVLFGVMTFLGLSPLHTSHNHEGHTVVTDEHASHRPDSQP